MRRFSGAARAALASVVLYFASEWVSPLTVVPPPVVQHAGQPLLYAPVAILAQPLGLLANVARIAAWCSLGAALAMGLWGLGTLILDAAAAEEPERSRRRTK
jgi:hypothetical protein